MPNIRPVVVVGAGTMGVGIAQIALAAGHRAYLVDTSTAQLERARDEIVGRLTKAGRSEESVRGELSLLASLSDVQAAGADRPIVIEAIVEDLAVKQQLLTQAMGLFGEEALYGTNTSSFSVTAIAAALPHPRRLVGIHFFNPVPVMKLVEIVPGQLTSQDVASDARAIVEGWGKVPILAQSTPGFIVNRVARPYYGESLRLAEEGSGPISLIDRLLRHGGTFRMGPFELMDLVGNDVNSTVTRTVWEGHNFDPRFSPSHLQRELVTAGRLGRKSGSGFYDYSESGPDRENIARVDLDREVRDEPEDSVVAAFLQRLGLPSPDVEGGLAGLGRVTLTRGSTAAEEAARSGSPTLVIDRPLDISSVALLAYAVSDRDTELERAVVAAAAAAGLELVRVRDLPGLVVARVASMLVNEAAEVVHLGLCSAEDVDIAMQLGTNYPLGLLEWGDRWSGRYVAAMVDALADHYRDPRYRTSPVLQRASLDAGARIAEAVGRN